MSNIRVCIQPFYSPELGDRAEGGIRRVVEAQIKYLPTFGIQPIEDYERADVFIGHGTIYPNRNDKPFISGNHGLHWADYKWPRWAHDTNKSVVEAMARASAVTAPSQWVREAITRGMYVDPVVVYHGVDADEWAHTDDHQGYVLWNKGRADPVSDPGDMHRLAQVMPEVRFVTTVGHETSNVTIAGVRPLPEMKPIIQRAGVYLATARETFGIGTLEALASGVPVVGWDYGGQHEIIRPGETGMLVPPGDYDGLASAVRAVMAKRERFSQAAIADVRERWLWPNRVRQYAEIIQRVYDDWHRPRSRVSIIVPCHNLARYLGDCLNSIRRQSFTDWECLILDDASNDDTGKIAQGYVNADSRFKYHRSETNLKLVLTLNWGATLAAGRYLMNVDADNVLPEEALAPLVAALDTDSSLDIVYGTLDTIDSDGHNRKRNPWPNGNFNWNRQIAHLNQIHSSALHRREVRLSSGGYRERQWRAEDGEFWTRVTSHGFRAAKVTDSPTLIYRLRSDSKSMGEGGDGDWTQWFPYRIGDGTGQGGYDALQKDRQGIPNAHLVPFSSSGEPPKGMHWWNIYHQQAPLVSVVIPVGPGHEKYLTDALDSLMAQDTHCWEAIVVNDTGNEWSSVESHLWARVVSTSGKRGPGAARNLGTHASRGKLILYLDSDDWLMPGDTLSRWLEEYVISGASYVYTDYVERQSDGSETVKVVSDYSQGNWRGEHAINILIAKADLESIGLFDETLTGWEDWDLFIKLKIAGLCGWRMAWPAFTYRFHTGTIREKSWSDKSSILPVFKERYGVYFDQYEGTKPMSPCCGGNADALISAKETLARIWPNQGESDATPMQPLPDAPQTGIVPMPVRMMFTGDSRGGITYYGKNGRQYIGGDNPYEKFIDAHADDVEHLISIGVFEKVVMPTPKETMAIVTIAPPPVQAPPIPELVPESDPFAILESPPNGYQAPPIPDVLRGKDTVIANLSDVAGYLDTAGYVGNLIDNSSVIVSTEGYPDNPLEAKVVKPKRQPRQPRKPKAVKP